MKKPPTPRQWPRYLLSVAPFSCPFIFLVSNIDSVTFQNMGHLRKQCFKIVLMARTERDSFIPRGHSLQGRKGCRSVPSRKTALFKTRQRGVFPHTRQVLGPGIGANLAVFHSRCHFSEFFPHPKTAQSGRSLLRAFRLCLWPCRHLTISTQNMGSPPLALNLPFHPFH